MRIWRGAGVVVVGLAWQARAHADDASIRARAHFAAALKAYEAKPPDLEGALVEFRAAYAEKPTASILRNIALSLKGLHRYPEAMAALEQMLAEDAGSLSPAVREAAAKALADMEREIATLRVTVQVAGQRPVEVRVDGQLVPEASLSRSIRVMPGSHVLTARSAGFNDASATVTVDRGQVDVPVIFAMELADEARGGLAITTDPPAADISVDGAFIARGSWRGEVGAGKHQVRVTASAYAPFLEDVVVRRGRGANVSVHLETLAALAKPAPPPVPARIWYVAAGGAFESETLALGPGFNENGARHGVTGGGLIGEIGVHLGKSFSFQLTGETGQLETHYTLDGGSARVAVLDWVLAPEIVFHTIGRVQFFTGFALGGEGQMTDASVAGKEISGAGSALMGLLEGGLQWNLERSFIAGAVFVDTHGVSGDDGQRLLLYTNSPASRFGVRLLVGYDL